MNIMPYYVVGVLTGVILGPIIAYIIIELFDL